MSDLGESLADRNVEVSRPSTSSTLQPLRSKGSVNNKIIDNKTSPSKKAHKTFTTMKQKQEDKNNSLLNSISTSVDDITNEVQNLNVTQSNADVNQSEITISKRKARKKEKIKRLSMPPPNPPIANIQPNIIDIQPNLNIQPESAPNNSNFSLLNGIPVQEYFVRCITPMYATATSSYLENLTYHPQFQYMNHAQVEMFHNRQTTSAPNTPLVYMTNRMQPQVANSPIAQSEPTTPKYLQNVMQHPLLSQSFKDNITGQLPNQNLEAGKTKDKHSPSKRKRKNKNIDENPEDKKFEPYISAEEVEQGIKDGIFIEGTLRINPKQFQHAYVSSTDRSEQDILIDGLKNRNRALEGDIIVVKLIEEIENEESKVSDCKQKKGKVVFIKVKVHKRTCIGSLKLMADKNRQKALFVPRDHRIPRLNIPFTCWPDNFYHDSMKYESTLFLAKIEDWYDTRFAVGKILRNIGQSGDMITEAKAILAQNDLDVTPFGPEVQDLYPRLDYTIPEDEIKMREDCRELCVFSIDPPNCRDIDDAVSCKILENGNYEIGVHISDVTHFLTENTILDEEVSEKATTIYLVERAYHMLPDDLCMLCSLFPGVDKLAFSVFWEINGNAEVLSHRFSKTIIHSCAQLAYDHAQAILEDREDAKDTFPETYNGYKFEDIQKSIKILGNISGTFRKQRFDGGALKIDQPKVSFKLSGNGLPESFWLYENKESHQLIEEFMLLANMTVAQRIYKDYPDLAFLRSHPPPSGFMMTQVAKALKPMGINLETKSAGSLHRSLMEHANSGNIGKAMVLNMLCAKPMARAKYFCAHGTDDDDFHHYALNVPLYTHFTSPIRRYADIMVHRLLAASIKFRDAPDWEVDKVRMVAAQCNKQKYNAKKAGEMSTELYMLKYIEMNSPVLVDAVVVEIRERYIDTIVVAMGLSRRIFFNSDFPGEFKCIKNEAGAKLSKMELTWKISDNLPELTQIIEVFSVLKIELVKGDDSHMVKVETKLVCPQSP